MEEEHREHVMRLAKADRRLHDIFENPELLLSQAQKKLRMIKPLSVSGALKGRQECRKLWDYQLVKLGWLLEALELERDFRKSVGAKIEADLADDISAHGGVVCSNEGNLVLREIPAKENPAIMKGGKNLENFVYEPVEFEMTPDIMFLYHIHAFGEENSRFTQPTNSGLKDSERRGMDCVLFTKLGGNRFSAFFYSSFRNKDGILLSAVIDLGVYEY